ncbi:DUF6893 family small protein [Cryobacterium melibiosiphilum]
MKFIGGVTVFALIASAAVAVVVGMRSIPDIQRYLKMREM